jgi:hypothetical protein
LYAYTYFLEYGMIIYYLIVLVAAVMPLKKGKRGSNRTATTMLGMQVGGITLKTPSLTTSAEAGGKHRH